MAADRSGLDVGSVAIAMSWFLEAVADELTKGRCVRIPGFGLFGPAPIPERHRRMSRDLTPRCKPVFSPSRGLRDQVAMGLGPVPQIVAKLTRHQNNHACGSKGHGRRVFTAMAAFRQQISSQLGRTEA
jgi:nucleoid DNA-binding protein